MLSGFAVTIALGHVGMASLVMVMQVVMFYEIVKLGGKKRMDKDLPGFRFLHWYWLMATLFLMHGKTLMSHYLRFDFVSRYFSVFVAYHSFLSFCFFCGGFVLFVCLLKKGFYRYQFKQLAWCWITILIVVVQSTFILTNIFQGLIWCLLPIALVICNDIFAYVFGYFFGRTPLIKLSPKKTWEGFIGGAFSTMIFAVLFSWLLMSTTSPIPAEFFLCPRTGLDISIPECDIPVAFTVQEIHLPFTIKAAVQQLKLPAVFAVDSFTTRPFYFHAIVLALFASIIGPFGGFFASGFKRAFKIKDFGDSIPGHGGVTDRMDCQVVMGLFTYVYASAFCPLKTLTSGVVLQQFLRLSAHEQQQLAQSVTQFLSTNG